MFETWLSDRDKLCLSAYGTRRLFDALKKAMWCSNKKLLENGAYLKNTIPSHIQHRCPRCVRFHAGGADTCKSKNMVSLIQRSICYLRVKQHNFSNICIRPLTCFIQISDLQAMWKIRTLYRCA